MSTMNFQKTLIGLAALTSSFAPVSALAGSFKDIPETHAVYDAAEYLKEKGIIGGYEDGTFRPDQAVNRAEAIKIIVAQIAKQEDLAKETSSVFQDVPGDAWYLPYVEVARKKGIVDGPPSKTSFLGTNPVLKVEFIKMLLLGNNENPDAFGEIRLPLSNDVSNPDEWFYRYLRFAVTSSMTMIGSDGGFSPARQLTRGDTALMLYRYMTYKEGRRTQALLSEAESEILVVLGSLEKNDIVQAEYASARALLAARGAHASKPDNNVVQGALKITESFRALVRGYRAGTSDNYDEVIRLAGDAWHLAGKAKEINPQISSLADQVQKIAANMADSARALKNG